MATTKIYRLTIAGKVRLVRAANQSQALRFVAADSITVSLATQDELVKDVGAGVAVETPDEPQPV